MVWLFAEYFILFLGFCFHKLLMSTAVHVKCEFKQYHYLVEGFNSFMHKEGVESGE